MSAIQQPKLHRFSLEQYYELGELGLLDQRTELLEGIITDMEPIGPYHANVGDHLSQIFQQQAGDRYRVRVQYPINLGRLSQPQPDLVLYRPGLWRGQHPGADAAGHPEGDPDRGPEGAEGRAALQGPG